MQKKRILFVIIIVIVILIISSYGYFVLKENSGDEFLVGKSKMISEGTDSQNNPKISGNYVVWYTSRYSDIMLYDISTGKLEKVTNDSEFHWNPDVSGDKIVWSTGGLGNNEIGYEKNTDIFLHNITTKETRQLTNETHGQWNPHVFGDIVVWNDGRNDNDYNKSGVHSNIDVYLYDLRYDMEVQITSNLSNQWCWSIYDNVIIWMDERYNTNSLSKNDTLFFYDLNLDSDNDGLSNYLEDTNLPNASGRPHPDPAEKRVSESILGKIGTVDIDGLNIVWTHTNQSEHQSDIYLHNLSTELTTRITNNSEYSLQCAINGNRIVWASRSVVYSYDLMDRKETKVTSDSQYAMVPDIYGNYIVYEGKENYVLSIFLFEID